MIIPETENYFQQSEPLPERMSESQLAIDPEHTPLIAEYFQGEFRRIGEEIVKVTQQIETCDQSRQEWDKRFDASSGLDLVFTSVLYVLRGKDYRTWKLGDERELLIMEKRKVLEITEELRVHNGAKAFKYLMKNIRQDQQKAESFPHMRLRKISAAEAKDREQAKRHFTLVQYICPRTAEDLLRDNEPYTTYLGISGSS